MNPTLTKPTIYSKGSKQSWHLRSLIRVFALRNSLETAISQGSVYSVVPRFVVLDAL